MNIFPRLANCLEKEMNVRLFGVGIEELNLIIEGQHSSKICGKSGFASAALATQDRYYQGSPPSPESKSESSSETSTGTESRPTAVETSTEKASRRINRGTLSRSLLRVRCNTVAHSPSRHGTLSRRTCPISPRHTITPFPLGFPGYQAFSLLPAIPV